MVKESEARVAASVAAAQARRPMADEEDDITGEVTLEVMSITFWFVGLQQEEIMRIIQNRLKPINLYRLRHIAGLCLTPCMTRTVLASRTVCSSSKNRQGPIKTLANLFTRCGPTSSINTPPSSFCSLTGRSRTFTLPSPSSTLTSISSPKCTSGKRRSSR